MSDPGNNLYRYRPLIVSHARDNANADKTVVQELENQELFLATIGENNDPMDGLQEVYWEGDAVLWNNFVKHYSLCLLDYYILIKVAADTELLDHHYIKASFTRDDLPSDEYKELYDILVGKLFKQDSIRKLLRILTGRQKLSQIELSTLLFSFQSTFLSTLNKVVKQKIGIEMMPNMESQLKGADFADLDKAILSLDPVHFEKYAEVIENINAQMLLLLRYQTRNQKVGKGYAASNMANLIGMFPYEYLHAIVENVYPDYYLACFSTTNDSPLMWSNYGDRHRGICLVFRSRSDDVTQYLELDNGDRLALQKVKYDNKPPSINYFKSLAHLPFPKVESFWTTDGGERSNLYDYYLNFKREKFWASYSEKTSHKMSDWNYEDGIRALKYAFWRESTPKESRIVKYKFDMLQGVIFGYLTPLETQVQVLEIVDRKLNEHGSRDFGFYRARYSMSDNKIVVKSLGLVKHTP